MAPLTASCRSTGRAAACTPRCQMPATSRSTAAHTSCASATPPKSTANCSPSSLNKPPPPTNPFTPDRSSIMSVHPSIVLEPAARELTEATASPTFLSDMGPEGARKVLDDLQADPDNLLSIDEEWVAVPAAVGDVRVRIVRPKELDGPLPVVVYMHGGGWILGNAETHDRLVRDLAVGAHAAVAFVEYTPSPEAH